jgi:adenosylcobinamide-phosphate synthase
MTVWMALAGCGALMTALAIDHWLGEPAARFHPVVWMGHYLNWAAGRLRPNPSPSVRDLKLFWLAAAYWWVGAATVFIVALLMQSAAFQLLWVFSVLTIGLALKPMLAWAMLRSEVQAVEVALG